MSTPDGHVCPPQAPAPASTFDMNSARAEWKLAQTRIQVIEMDEEVLVVESALEEQLEYLEGLQAQLSEAASWSQ